MSTAQGSGFAAASHVPLDHVLVVAIALVWPLAEWLWYYPRSVRAIAAGAPGARMCVYRNLLVPEWGFTAGVLALWAACGRPWTALMLGWSTPLRLGGGFTMAALVLYLLWAQRSAILARPERLERVRRKAAFADPLLPRTPAERRGFVAVAVTAGICEEVLMRGFVMWYAGVWTGPALALAISSVLFGFGHIYLGVPQVGRSAVAGAVLGLVVLASGSLWPAIVIHAALDLSSGDVGFQALNGLRERSPSPGVPAEA
jgi:CAAX protease family protein